MKKILKLVLIIVILATVGFAIFKFYEKEEQNAENTVVGDVVQGEIERVDADTNTFVHKGYGFSLNFPSNMTASNFREGEGEMVNFQSSENGDWFQIYISSWNEEEGISAERIRQDIPDIVITTPQQVVIGPGQREGVGPVALIFFSQDSGLGDTREIWFVYHEQGRGVASFLYQITTYKRLDSMIGEVLSTLDFN